MKLKVCGMRDAENIGSIAALSPHFMGFIFYGPSPRNASEILLKTSLDQLPTNTLPVAVFVDEEISSAISLLEKFGIRAVQLHGNESIEYCKLLKDREFLVFKVFPIDEKTDFEAMSAFNEVCDYFLFDTKSPKHGGTGQKFDWSLLDKYKNEKPVLLSGGIGPDDVAQVKEALTKHPWIAGLDLNSRFEIAPGIKEPERVKTFFEALKA